MNSRGYTPRKCCCLDLDRVTYTCRKQACIMLKRPIIRVVTSQVLSELLGALNRNYNINDMKPLPGSVAFMVNLGWQKMHPPTSQKRHPRQPHPATGIRGTCPTEGRWGGYLFTSLEAGNTGHHRRLVGTKVLVHCMSTHPHIWIAGGRGCKSEAETGV